MQIIIDIPDSAYKVCYDLRNVGDTNCLADILVNAVGVGTPIPDNATNGDIIKAMFQNIESIDAPLMKVYVMVYTKDHKCMRFDSEWWNAPYQKGE